MWKIIGVVIGILFLGFIVKLVFLPVHIAGNILDSQYKIADKTFTAENEIYNYETISY